MASSKKINFNVDTKAIIKRKRRRSDLVIMWQSFYDVTLSIILEFWSMIIKIWHITRLWFDSSERLVIQTWLEKYLPWTPTDYAESWRDGRLLSLLLNKLHPGCLPDAEKLDSEYSLRNVYHAFDVLEEYFDIKPDLTPEEIVTCANGSEKKFYELLSQLKQTTEVKNDTDETVPKTEILEETESDMNALNKHCIAKGTGLVVGFVDRMTHFIVFYANLVDLDVVVDIKGPSDTVCCERITKRSPKKRYSSPDIMDYTFSNIYRSVSNPEDKISYKEEENDFISKIIPLDYEILPNQINFAYKPLCKGQHKISVLWHGLHVSDSPYTVTVEDSSKINNINNSVHIKPALKASNTTDKLESKKPSVRFQDSKERCGKTLKKRVLRYIVKIDGKDVAVDTNNTDSLATELLKMDYDYDNSLALGRRNSWGFTGDAERKVSVIRQFCVDVDVMEAQSKHKRSKSLVGNENINGLSKSDSFNDLKLSCIRESAVKTVDFYASDDTLPHTDFDSNENLLEDLESELGNPNCTGFESSSFDERQVNSNEIEVLETPVTKSCYIGEESKTENSRLVSSLSAEKLSPSAENLNDDLTKSSDILCENINELPSNVNKRDVESKSDGLKQVSLKMGDDSSVRKINRKSSKVPVFVKGKPSTLRFVTNNKKLLKSQKYVKSKNTKKNKFDKTDKKAARFEEKEQIDRLSISSNGSHSLQNKSEDLNNKEINIETKRNVIHSEEISRQPETVTDEAVNFNYYNIQPLQIYTTRNINDVSQNINGTSQHGNDTTHQSVRQNSSGSPEYINTKIMDSWPNTSNTLSSKGIKPKTNFETRATSLPECGKFEKKFNKINGKEMSNNSATSSKNRSSNNINDDEQTRPIKTHSLLSIGHFNFKQFNPSSENAASFRVKNRILEWEATISGENKNSKASKNTAIAEISETIGVKAKLSFWENAYKKDDETSYIDKRNDIATDRLVLKDSINSEASKNISDEIPFGNTGKQKKKMDETILTTAKTNSFLSTIPGKKIADKFHDPVLGPSNKQTRSFSDPIIDTNKRAEEVNLDSSFEISGNIYSSNEIDLAMYSGDESSASDQLKLSTEDEYIDDEISESASMFWGELSLLKNQVNSNTSSDAGCSDLLDPDYFRQRYLNSNFFPSECKIFGIANYFGYVALKNRFQVLTKDAGTGNLSASVQGFGRHDVCLVSVTYANKDVYDVTYQVMAAGYYLISVKWMDTHIPGSPFVCKVTF